MLPISVLEVLHNNYTSCNTRHKSNLNSYFLGVTSFVSTFLPTEKRKNKTMNTQISKDTKKNYKNKLKVV